MTNLELSALLDEAADFVSANYLGGEDAFNLLCRLRKAANEKRYLAPIRDDFERESG